RLGLTLCLLLRQAIQRCNLLSKCIVLILLAQGGENTQQEFEEGSDSPLLLAQPRNTQTVTQVSHSGKAMIDESDEVRLANATRPDEERIVLCRCEHTSAAEVHQTRDEGLALHEDGFECFVGHQTRREMRQEWCCHVPNPR